MDHIFILTALVLGLGGSLHCLGMCGPIVMMLPYREGTGSVTSIAFYHLGKSFSYGLLGIIAGLLGSAFVSLGFQQILSIAAGIFVIVIALFPFLEKYGLNKFLFKISFSKYMQLILKNPRLHHYLILGMMNGWLPCGLVYTALAAASVTGHPFKGFVFMFVFGLGTMPALALIAFFRQQFAVALRRRLARINLVLSLLLGSVMIVRGMNLGIPYLSPKAAVVNSLPLGRAQDTILCH